MHQELIIDIIGWIGAIILLAAYAAVSRGRTQGTSFKYQLWNGIGSIFLLINAAYYRAFPSSFVNFIWIGIAIFTILKNRKGRVAVARTLLIILALIPCGAMAADAEPPQTEFFLPTPDGWRTETIPFPLDFAPDLDYSGLEELRFAPGMFDADAEDFWTYAFIWWIDDEALTDPDRLERDLERYFSGLADSVAEAREFEHDHHPHYDVQIMAGGPEAPFEDVLKGYAAVFDPFVTRKRIVLNFKVTTFLCPDQSKQAVVFALSPKPFLNDVWSLLDDIRLGFRCESEEAERKTTVPE